MYTIYINKVYILSTTTLILRVVTFKNRFHSQTPTIKLYRGNNYIPYISWSYKELGTYYFRYLIPD
ncbi:hypothetical protein WAI453_002346 [Rhynchosporium graminicola]